MAERGLIMTNNNNNNATVTINGVTMNMEQWVQEMVVPDTAAVIGVPEENFAGWMPPEVP